MKKIDIKKTTVFLFTFILMLNSCKYDSLPSLPTVKIDPLSGARIGSDLSVYNHEQSGKFLYTYVKYYLGTIDAYSFLPKDMQADFKKQYADNIERTKGWTHNQIIDDLVLQKTYSIQQGEVIKNDHKQLLELINKQPSSKAIMDWYDDKETDVIENKDLSIGEREEILAHKAVVKYALKWKVEQNEINIAANAQDQSARVTDDCTFWSLLACYVGTISGGSGLGNSVGGAVGLAKGLEGDAIAGLGIVGGVVGGAISLVNAIITCQCASVNYDVCQAPLTVSFPYDCYTYGNPLLCEAFAFGNIRPGQFIFDFRSNNNLDNHLYSNFRAETWIRIPGDKLTSSISSIAAEVTVHCPSGSLLDSYWYGWYSLSDLGKPFFTISGQNNLSVSQASYSFINYQIDGPVSSTNATIYWELIPSGYPGYSATGTILSGNNGNFLTVRWDAHAGFANLKCTTSTQCATVVQYYTIHIM